LRLLFYVKYVFLLFSLSLSLSIQLKSKHHPTIYVLIFNIACKCYTYLFTKGSQCIICIRCYVRSYHIIIPNIVLCCRLPKIRILVALLLFLFSGRNSIEVLRQNVFEKKVALPWQKFVSLKVERNTRSLNWW